jgi:4-amino-4-deoxy-L-arabinose transferase-like glycosyltransferase
MSAVAPLASTAHSTLTSERKKSWWVMAGLCALLLVLAALRPLAVPDEGRYGEVGRWMLQSGDWLTPRSNGIPFFHKPPLLYWLQAMSLAVFGSNAWALRLVPAVHAAMMLVVLYLSARQIAGEAVARRAAIMLGTSLTFLVGGQYVNHDMMVAAWISVAIWCFGLAFLRPDQPDAALARWGFVACALGMLSKGLIGFVLPGLVIFLWLLWTRRLKKIVHLPWASGLGLFALIVVPWFALVQQKYPGFLRYMFWHQQFERYTAQTFNNQQPWWFYLLAMVLLLFPWVFLAFSRTTLPRFRGPAAPVALGVGVDAPASQDGISLCWIWIMAITVFFSIPSSKLLGYILPVVPPVALLAAVGWERRIAHRQHASRIFLGLCLLNICVAAAAVLNAARFTASSRSEDVARVLACAAGANDTIYTAGDFPFDLPFYAQITHPMVLLADWPRQRRTVSDGWEREFFEGADFDAASEAFLQPLGTLATAAATPGNWLVVRRQSNLLADAPGWALHHAGVGWALYRSSGTPSRAGGQALAPESPEAGQHKGLPGCKQ